MADIEVRIEKIVAGGEGLARHEGRVVFVPGAAPGEVHLVRPFSEKKDYLRARSIERRTDSDARRSPPCPYYETCGGCALMHMTPAAQLEAKKVVLLEGIERSTKQAYGGPLSAVAAEELGYRNRLRFGVVLVEGKPLAGFRRRGSHEIVDIDRCLVASPTIQECWVRVRRALVQRRPLARAVVAVELEESTSEPGRIAARFVVSTTHELRWIDAPLRDALVAEIGLEGLVVSVSGRGPLARSGNAFVEHRVAGFTLRQSVGSFFQSNRFLLERLVEAVLPGEGEEPPRALDLYSGVGLFSLPLSKHSPSVIGVENDTTSLRDARENAARAGLAGLRFVRSEAAAYLARGKLREDDFVVLDPPRGGLSPGLVDSLGTSPVRSVRYVSCDPPALFRDVARLAARGFRLEGLVLLDLFPNTHHFEVVASFARSSQPSP